MIQWAMAAALICGASVFTVCTSNDDNPATPDLGVKEKIIGKWVRSEGDGQPVLTNSKMVYTFVSATKAYVSASLTRPEVAPVWAKQMEVAVAIPIIIIYRFCFMSVICLSVGRLCRDRTRSSGWSSAR